ncbi:MAG: family 16 glycoside hydrolase, partial [Bacteroidota bacterium]
MKKLLFITCGILAFYSFTGRPSHTASDRGWVSLFNGKDLKGWDTYLGPERDSTGRQLSDQPLGLNKDPRHVFSVVSDPPENETAPGSGAMTGTGSGKVIRISGEDVGALTTQKEFENYHLQVLFRWGVLTWGSKKNKKKDSGLLYHSVGPY